jgi:hypothetical protein
MEKRGIQKQTITKDIGVEIASLYDSGIVYLYVPAC